MPEVSTITSSTLREYYYLTKPGIIYGNALNATAGFLLASKGHIHFWHLLATLLAISLIIASGCAVNNYLDQEIDAKMSRTKQRALVTGMISNNAALLFAGILAIAGFLTLNHQTNHLTVWIGAIGYVDYILAYGYAKRHSIYGTIVGSISGATPLVAGYTAVTNHFDIAALLLFIMLVLWQMPHFYAIAIYRLKDYRTAGIPVWPVRRGVRSTKRQIVGFVAAFLVASCLLTVFGYTHYAYLIAMSLIGLGWLWFGIKGFHTANETVWARRMFLISLIAILGLDIMLSVGSVLI